MGRIFRRGELKEVLVLVLLSLGEAHGYAIMTELKERIGGGWKPSPGAIYPALLALVEMGYVRTDERDGTRVYSLTEAGRRAAQGISSASRWASLTARSESDEGRVTVGALLDRFAADSKLRRRLAGPEQKERIEVILERASGEIEQALTKGEEDG
jgi:DNA-binding PadR family transcriptional regulator